MTVTFMLSVMIKKKLKKHLPNTCQTEIIWFYENYTILNTGKCHYMCMGKDVEENETLQISSQQKMIKNFRIKIDQKAFQRKQVKN